ncbi:hypothetical protein BAUCODRAFT_31979 [Baudoinia panamericana UAMH 10762]|uniref:Large ribosomal subunit protein mL67 n=1 Tax=Baudoinia panamericana (strain UAMH 10762) TaxID=717646 RepID=M2NFF8_BAUPA|nr:uncharacterized protein BAUCODRAFT_31979 [Baudoinia panamericana UAMH 10762]EMC97969.1 hypothetical protein BAUCODRAFT_31979 [Baudoinia panamericana UAMH 10762]
MRKARPGSSRAPTEHGRNIYAYCHVRTNQVVYSLSQTLNSNATIKQLPDTGANNTPNTTRKDLWKPLYTLTVPSSAQGLSTFRQLREYRKLHELNWEPPLSLSEPYSDAEIYEMKQKLAERGGNKKESVYDIIKRRKQRQRERIVMDQKANSVADVAAILFKQAELGAKTAEERERMLRGEREKEVKVMLELADQASKGGLQKLDEQIAAVKQRLKDGEGLEEAGSKRQFRRELYNLNARRLRMVFASNAVQEARIDGPERLRTARMESAVATDSPEEMVTPGRRSGNTTVSGDTTTGSEKAAQADGGVAELDWIQVLPSFPPRNPENMPKRGAMRRRLERLDTPIFSTEGVTMRWNNLLDAEYAEAWPDNIAHEAMGWTRNVAPRPDAQPISDVAVFTESRWNRKGRKMLSTPSGSSEDAMVGDEEYARKRKEEVDGESKMRLAEEKTRKAVVDGVKSKILARVREKEEERQRERQERIAEEVARMRGMRLQRRQQNA